MLCRREDSSQPWDIGCLRSWTVLIANSYCNNEPQSCFSGKEGPRSCLPRFSLSPCQLVLTPTLAKASALNNLPYFCAVFLGVAAAFSEAATGRNCSFRCLKIVSLLWTATGAVQISWRTIQENWQQKVLAPFLSKNFQCWESAEVELKSLLTDDKTSSLPPSRNWAVSFERQHEK